MIPSESKYLSFSIVPTAKIRVIKPSQENIAVYIPFTKYKLS